MCEHLYEWVSDCVYCDVLRSFIKYYLSTGHLLFILDTQGKVEVYSNQLNLVILPWFQEILIGN